MNFSEKLPPVWKSRLSQVMDKPFFKKLNAFLDAEYRDLKVIYPDSQNIMLALEEVDLPQVKVVIIGQDPYHGAGQATGLSFAIPNLLKTKPPSLKNIFKELESDLGRKLPEGKSDLRGWVAQGVLLLNTVFTVEEGKPLSHRDQGWEEFTNYVIDILNEREKPMVFVLWGSHAQKLKCKIDSSKHIILETPHPSPLSAYRGFFGSRIFSQINESLERLGWGPMDWQRISIDENKV